MNPTAQPLAPGERSRQTDQLADHHGVTAPSPFSSPPCARRKQTSYFPGPPRPPTHGALPSPRTRSTVPRPGATTTAVGNHLPSAPTPMPLTGTAAPATGSGTGPGAWSRGIAAAVGPEHGAGHSFLWPPAAALEPRWPVASPSPPCDNQPPPPPRCHHHLARTMVMRTIKGRAVPPRGYRGPCPHRRHHHRRSTDRHPPPCPGRHGYRPGVPLPPPLRRPVPLPRLPTLRLPSTPRIAGVAQGRPGGGVGAH